MVVIDFLGLYFFCSIENSVVFLVESHWPEGIMLIEEEKYATTKSQELGARMKRARYKYLLSEAFISELLKCCSETALQSYYKHIR